MWNWRYKELIQYENAFERPKANQDKGAKDKEIAYDRPYEIAKPSMDRFCKISCWIYFENIGKIFVNMPTMGGVDNWEEFIEVYEGVLQLLEHNNLWFKGKKVQILRKLTDFLGWHIKDGKIHPFPHHM